MRPRCGKRICVTYKDIDSLLYRVETEDLYKDIYGFNHLLDLSDYPTYHPLFDASNKKVPLTMTEWLSFGRECQRRAKTWQKDSAS